MATVPPGHEVHFVLRRLGAGPDGRPGGRRPGDWPSPLSPPRRGERAVFHGSRAGTRDRAPDERPVLVAVRAGGSARVLDPYRAGVGGHRAPLHRVLRPGIHAQGGVGHAPIPSSQPHHLLGLGPSFPGRDGLADSGGQRDRSALPVAHPHPVRGAGVGVLVHAAHRDGAAGGTGGTGAEPAPPATGSRPRTGAPGAGSRRPPRTGGDAACRARGYRGRPARCRQSPTAGSWRCASRPTCG